MGKLRYSEIEESDFVPLNELLLEDTEEIKELKSLYQKEPEYSMFLGPIESFIAYYYYYDNPNLKDVQLVKVIRKIRSNFDKNLDFFNGDFEREFIGVISLVLKDSKRKITKHELYLVLKYILWCIDNRKHTGDPRGYLNWIANFFNLLNKEKKKDFDRFYEGYGERFGYSEEVVKTLKGEEPSIELPANEEALSIFDSENFEDQNDEDVDEDFLWEKGGFIRPMTKKEIEEKRKSINMKHDEDINYDCKKCGKKISLHNRDWHDEMCDDCFDKEYFEED